jgi:hypothetical protein
MQLLRLRLNNAVATINFKGSHNSNTEKLHAFMQHRCTATP